MYPSIIYRLLQTQTVPTSQTFLSLRHSDPDPGSRPHPNPHLPRHPILLQRVPAIHGSLDIAVRDFPDGGRALARPFFGVVECRSGCCQLGCGGVCRVGVCGEPIGERVYGHAKWGDSGGERLSLRGYVRRDIREGMWREYAGRVSSEENDSRMPGRPIIPYADRTLLPAQTTLHVLVHHADLIMHGSAPGRVTLVTPRGLEGESRHT